MRVAICGGSGFVGSNLVLHLQHTEPSTEIVIVDTAVPQVPIGGNTRYVYADVRNLASLVRAFEGCQEVYHLAGVLGTSELLPITSLAAEVNVAGVANVLDACVMAHVERVYNVAKPHFDSLHENTYTLTKNAGELLGLLYREKHGLKVATVRWLNAVGPYQHLYPIRKLVPCMVLFALEGIPLEIYGDGTQTIDPIDARDMARFTVYACRHLDGERVVDLGSGRAISCNDAARLIVERVRHRHHGPKSAIVHVPMRPGEKEGVNLVADMSYWTSIGMATEHSFESSIDSVIDHVMKMPATHLRNSLAFYGKKPSR